MEPFPDFSGRSVQILRVKPELVFDLLRGKKDVRLDERFFADFANAKLVECRYVGGLIWLYLEKEGWPVIPAGEVPWAVHIGVWNGLQFTITSDYPKAS